MERLKNILEEQLTENLNQIIISNPRRMALAQKVKIRPVLLKEQLNFQVTEYKGILLFIVFMKNLFAFIFCYLKIQLFF